MVLLSDGESNTGPDPLEAAQLAAARGVRVYTVGIGTPRGTTLSVEGWSMQVRLDEDTLRAIASITRGEYFRAADAPGLRRIYDDLGARIALGEKRAVEMTALVVALGALLAMLGALVSMFRTHRIL